jgi:hypothetical protein
MILFNCIFGFLGFVYLFSGIYKWKRIWKMARGIYFPDVIGEKGTRLLYMIGGGGMVGSAIGFMLQDLSQNRSNIFHLIGISIMIVISVVLFRRYEGISIIKFIKDKPST